jgi:hypothetical protein
MGCTDPPGADRLPRYEAPSVREFACPTRAELSRVAVRAFLAAYDIAYGADGELPTFLAKITLDGVEFEITVDHLRALVGDEFGPPVI